MTTTAPITVLPTTWTVLQAALDQRRPLWVTYHGRRRLICPHALGWHDQRALVLGYQTGGDTHTGSLDPDPQKRWRCLYVDEITHTAPADPDNHWATPNNYHPAQPFPHIDTLAAAITVTR